MLGLCGCQRPAENKSNRSESCDILTDSDSENYTPKKERIAQLQHIQQQLQQQQQQQQTQQKCQQQEQKQQYQPSLKQCSNQQQAEQLPRYQQQSHFSNERYRYTHGISTSNPSIRNALKHQKQSQAEHNRALAPVKSQQNLVTSLSMHDIDTRSVKSSMTSSLFHLYKGQLKLTASINYGHLTIHIEEARQLCHPNDDVTCNTYVRACLYPDNGKRTKCQTDMKFNTNSPVYNEKFSIELLPNDARLRLLISVWHRQTEHSASEFIGCMSFGLHSMLEKNTVLSGWFFLLSEELGKKKHLQSQKSKGGSSSSSIASSSCASSVLSLHDIASHCEKHAQMSKIRSSSSNNKNNRYGSDDSDAVQPCSRAHRHDKSVRLTGSTAQTNGDDKNLPSTRSAYANNINQPYDEKKPPWEPSYAVCPADYWDDATTDDTVSEDTLADNSISTSFCSETSDTSICQSYNCDVVGQQDPCSSDSAISVDSSVIVLRRGRQGYGCTLNGSGPAKILHIVQGSAADEAGLRPGDCVVRVNGECVWNWHSEDLASYIRQCGQEITIEVHRQRSFEAEKCKSAHHFKASNSSRAHKILLTDNATASNATVIRHSRSPQERNGSAAKPRRARSASTGRQRVRRQVVSTDESDTEHLIGQPRVDDNEPYSIDRNINDRQQFINPNERQQFTHIDERQQSAYHNERQQVTHTNDRQQHINDRQQFTHTNGRQQFTHTNDRQQHINDRQQFIHTNDRQQSTHICDRQQSNYNKAFNDRDFCKNNANRTRSPISEKRFFNQRPISPGSADRTCTNNSSTVCASRQQSCTYNEQADQSNQWPKFQHNPEHNEDDRSDTVCHNNKNQQPASCGQMIMFQSHVTEVDILQQQVSAKCSVDQNLQLAQKNSFNSSSCNLQRVQKNSSNSSVFNRNGCHYDVNNGCSTSENRYNLISNGHSSSSNNNCCSGSNNNNNDRFTAINSYNGINNGYYGNNNGYNGSNNNYKGIKNGYSCSNAAGWQTESRINNVKSASYNFKENIIYYEDEV